MHADSLEVKGIHHLQIKLSEDEYNRLDDKARSARMKITPFARDFFIAALDADDGDKEGVSVTSRKWCKLLDHMLTRGSREQREVITSFLRTYSAVVASKK